MHYDMKALRSTLITLAAALLLASCGGTQKLADRDTRGWRYEIEAVGTGVQGTYQIKVWSYSSNPNIAIEQAKKNAIHGVIFKGFAGARGVSGQQPMTTNSNLYNERADYFEPFFATGGKYLQFINLTNNGAIAYGDRQKIGKEYKIGIVVSVNKDALRRELENAGIIQKLGGMF